MSFAVKDYLVLSNENTLHAKQSSHIEGLLQLEIRLLIEKFGSSTLPVPLQTIEELLEDSLIEA